MALKDEDFLTYDERRALKREAKAVKAKLAQDDYVIQNLMALSDGRTWMREKLELCRVFQTSFSSDALAMAFAEGQRNVGLILLAELMRACPEAYIQMMGEQSGRRDDDRADAEPRDDGSDGDDSTND